LTKAEVLGMRGLEILFPGEFYEFEETQTATWRKKPEKTT
jgi:hypothetical protein